MDRCTRGPAVGLIPLDDRPCTFEFPMRIAEIAGMDIATPPRELLGCFLQPGDPDTILDWVQYSASDLHSLIVSLEMIVYGGLIASRSPDVSENEVRRRLARFFNIACNHPDLRVYASGVIMRITTTARSQECIERWRLLQRFSILSSKVADGLASDMERDELVQVTRDLPHEAVEEYEVVRRRNHAVNLSSVFLASLGVFDFLVIGQEDAALAGPHRSEQKAILDVNRRLSNSALLIHPGADELNLILLAREIVRAETSRLRGRKPPIVLPIFLPQAGATAVPKFEDRQLIETVESHICACGAVLSDVEWGCNLRSAAEAADIILLVHAPDPWRAQEHQFDHVAMAEEDMIDGQQTCHYRDEFEDAMELLKWAADRGKIVGVADVRTVNGADPDFVKAVIDVLPPGRLAAYAGWNTSANSIGTCLAQAIAAWSTSPVSTANIRFLFERLVDDYLYQSVYRLRATKRLLDAGKDPWNFSGDDTARDLLNLELEDMVKSARSVFDHYFASCPAGEFRLTEICCENPWDRTFECRVNATIEEVDAL